jgi:hypothetical protein
LVVSCKDVLNVPAKGSLNKKVLANKKGVNKLLIGAYAALNGQNLGADGYYVTGADNWFFGSVVGSDAHKGSTPGDQAGMNSIILGNALPTSGYINNRWVADYAGVERCNSVLKVLSKVKDLSNSEKKEIEGQARFLRGHFYFDLKKMFNMVPWIDENTKNINQPNDSSIWPKIEADFKFAMENLPETQSEVGRANKWAAAAYLAKTYVFEHKWDKAKPLYDKIIAKGVTSNGLKYKLVDNFKDVFRAATENNSETVFAVQAAVHDGSGTIANARKGDILNYPYPNSPLKCCGFFQPSVDLVNSYRTDSKTGLPLISLNNKFAYDDEMVKNDLGISSNQHFTPYQGTLDPRLDWTVGRRGVPYHDWGPHPGKKWIRDQSSGGPYDPMKNIYWHATKDKYFSSKAFGPGIATNYAIIRFASVLLLAAETEDHVGNLEKARKYVNRVRKRVADDTYGNGWVSYKLNIPFATAVVDNKSEVTSVDATPGDWVVVKNTKSTYQLLKSPASNINNWQEYKNANYKIGLYPGPWTNKKAALLKIHFEEKLELAMEGHRFFDLVRWGTASKQLNHFYKYEGSIFPFYNKGHFTKSKNEYFPIPQNQIDLSERNGKPVLQQNPGY